VRTTWYVIGASESRRERETSEAEKGSWKMGGAWKNGSLKAFRARSGDIGNQNRLHTEKRTKPSLQKHPSEEEVGGVSAGILTQSTNSEKRI